MEAHSFSSNFLHQIRVINTWQAIWGPDAEEFHPERWLDLPKNYHSQHSLMSFIVGPHACIGKTMAIIEMKTVLAYVFLPLFLILFFST
jgi:cytochrome P450